MQGRRPTLKRHKGKVTIRLSKSEQRTEDLSAPAEGRVPCASTSNYTFRDRAAPQLTYPYPQGLYVKTWQEGMMANRWLFKTEPGAYSFARLQKDKKTVWDGVKNNLALKNLSAIKIGNQILIYHTGGEKAAVGVARALSGAYPDPRKKDPKLLVVDIGAVKPLPRSVTLGEMKAQPKLAKFDLLRLPRLSIMQVSDDQWDIIEGMAKK